MNTVPGERCIYGSDRHTDHDLTPIDDRVSHVAQNPDMPSVKNGVCMFHANWLDGRGWNVTALSAEKAL